MSFDLNCDLGEGEAISKTRALMRVVTSVNVACGGHAGDLRSMEACIRLAKVGKVRLGAHPGLTGEFGRGRVEMTPSALQLLLLQQLGTLEKVARAMNATLHHVKLHGSLYHASDTDPHLARAYLRAVARWWPTLKVYARAHGLVSRLASSEKVTVWPEAFVDRAYRPDGSLVPRTESFALISDARLAFERVELLCRKGLVQTVTGQYIPLRAKTICVHSDTGEAVAIAKSAKSAFLPKRARLREN